MEHDPEILLDYYIEAGIGNVKDIIPDEESDESTNNSGNTVQIYPNIESNDNNTTSDKSFWNRIQHDQDRETITKYENGKLNWINLDIEGINLRENIENFWNSYSDILDTYTDIDDYLVQFNTNSKAIYSIFDVLICFKEIVNEVVEFNKVINAEIAPGLPYLAKIIQINDDVFSKIDINKSENDNPISYLDVSIVNVPESDYQFPNELSGKYIAKFNDNYINDENSIYKNYIVWEKLTDPKQKLVLLENNRVQFTYSTNANSDLFKDKDGKYFKILYMCMPN